MVQIRMLNKGPNSNYEPGSVILVDEVRAAVLISGGHAEPFNELETATAMPPENAMIKRPPPRTAGKKG